MPRAIEIRVDPILKCVVIDTNFPNREVNGAIWAPRLFRLGWNSPEELWEAMNDTVPTFICGSIALRESYELEAEVLVHAGDETDEMIEGALEQIDREAHAMVRYMMPIMQDRRYTPPTNGRSRPS